MIKIPQSAAIRSPWFIGWMVLLLVVIAMNVIMILFSLDGSPGLVAEDFYERGQLYDKQLNERQKSDPGWHSEFIRHGEIYIDQQAKISFNLLNKKDASINAEKVTLFIYRPSSKKADFSVVMTSEDGLIYSSDVTFSLLGIWDLVVEVKKQKQVRNFAKRLTIYNKVP